MSASTQQQNPLSRKLKKILETRLENEKELVDALKALSTFFGENTLRSRRGLRGDVEKKSLETCEKFEAQFKVVKERLDKISGDISEMNTCCQQMTKKLKVSKESTYELMKETSKLRTERKQNDLQSLLASSFLEHYQLTTSEIKILENSKVVNEAFFVVLSRVKEIHRDCKLLLHSKHQTTGLELMESMALYQETAYEKLYRWSQNECRSMTGDVPDVSSALCHAFAALEDRRVLLRYTFDELTAARRPAIVRCFIEALTTGGNTGKSRPIELYSHNPVRYVGDILAWLHQMVASEKELLRSMLKQTNIIDHMPMVVEVLGKIVEGVCRPLKVRIEQVITSQPGAAVLFGLSNLLKFYTETLRGIFESGQVTVVETVAEMEQLSYQMFYTSLSCHGSKVREKVDIPPPDLSPSQSVNETLELLKEVLSIRDFSAVPLHEQRDDYEKIFGSLIDPVIHCCVIAATGLNVSDTSTYLLNCLYHIQVTLSVYAFTDVKMNLLATQMEVYVENLTKKQAEYVLDKSALKALEEALHEGSESTLDEQLFTSSMNSFNHFLSQPDAYNIPQWDLIRSTKFRNIIRKQALEIVANTYGSIYEEITKGFSESCHLDKTPDHVRNLLH